MSKALELTDALQQVVRTMKDLLHPIQAQFYDDKWRVQVAFYRDLEQIPGQVRFTELIISEFHAAKASKELQGVEFVCYLTGTEYELVKERKTA